MPIATAGGIKSGPLASASGTGIVVAEVVSAVAPDDPAIAEPQPNPPDTLIGSGQMAPIAFFATGTGAAAIWAEAEVFLLQFALVPDQKSPFTVVGVDPEGFAGPVFAMIVGDDELTGEG